jgi:hypothetical protein
MPYGTRAAQAGMSGVRGLQTEKRSHNHIEAVRKVVIAAVADFLDG